MKRLFVLVYGVVAYALFLVAFLYAIGFVSGVVVPKSINSGVPAPSAGEALLVNVLLLGLFGVQHSVMARRGFKRWWTRIVPRPIERSTFVLATCAVLFLLFWQWRPLTDPVWTVEQPALVATIWAIHIAGWVIALVSTFIIDHFDLFGLRQVVFYALGKPYPRPAFQVRLFYRHVRHPLLLGFTIAFWAVPTMTLGHLVFAIVTSLYMLVAIQLEERDLVAAHGEDYVAYRRRVPMLLPLGLGARERAPADGSEVSAGDSRGHRA